MIVKKLKTWKMRHKHDMTWITARNTEKSGKCEMHMQDLEYGEKTEKPGKLDIKTL